MKQLIILISFIFLVLPAIAQEDNDQATIRCYYRFSQKKKTGDVFLQDTMTLDIGSQMSRYYDVSRVRRDSAFSSVLTNFDVTRINSVSVFKDVNPDDSNRLLGDTYKNNAYDGISEQIYKNRKNGNIIMLDNNFSEWYKGADPVGVMNWTILPDEAEFLDYSCQKAILQFRGRNYEAWFTTQIPINDGPWKFFGLPGLILKVNDTEGQFIFECIGLEYLDVPYAIEIPKRAYFDCNRKDYIKAMNKKSGGQSININGGDIVISSFMADTSFQHIELD